MGISRIALSDLNPVQTKAPGPVIPIVSEVHTIRRG
jgi:hypothetical protein